MSADRPKIRAVFDCMVFLQGAARRESPSGACLLLVELAVVELCLSTEIIAEVRDVLARPRVQRQFPALTGNLVDQFAAALERHALVFPEVTRVFAYERDSKDEPYLNLAIAAGANYLVSRDTDILDLAKATDLDGERLRRQAPQLQIPGSSLVLNGDASQNRSSRASSDVASR